MKENLELIMIIWLLAGVACGIVGYQTIGTQSDWVTQTEVQEMIQKAREEERMAVLRELDKEQVPAQAVQ